MNKRIIKKQINKFNFIAAYETLYENGYIFSFDNLAKDFPKVNGITMYMFLKYAISKDENVEKHIAICNYLYFMEPYVSGADSIIKRHIERVLEIEPQNKIVISDWIFGIYGNNPESPFSETEIQEYRKRLESICK